MAILSNPNYGRVPGAPQGLNWWDQNVFRMSDILPPPPPPPPPQPPIVETPQDRVTQQAAAQLVSGQGGGGGGEGGGGLLGSGQTGNVGGASGGGQNTTTSGVQGVYAQGPLDINSQFGTGLGLAGNIPGQGASLPLSGLGGMIDAGRYQGALNQAGIPGNINPWSAGLSSIAASIGVPFTDLNLASVFGMPTARQQVEDALRANLAAVGPNQWNTSMYEGPHAFGINEANARVDPVTRESSQYASYPAGFMASELTRQTLNEDVARAIAQNNDIFGTPDVAKGAFDAGAWGGAYADKGGTDPGGSTGSASDKGGVGAGQGAGSGGTSGWGGDKGGDRDTGYNWRGGLIGAPPGRYEQGGRVRGASRAMMQEDIEVLRNALFGNRTAGAPMPSYDDERRLQRRIYDMPQLHIRGPEIPMHVPGVPGFLTPDPGYGRGLSPIGRDTSSAAGAPLDYGGTSSVAPGAYAAGGAVRAAGHMPTYRDPNPPPGSRWSTGEWSDMHGVPDARYGNSPPPPPSPTLRPFDDPTQDDVRGPPALSPREQMIQDAMEDYLRGQARDAYPEAFAAGGTVGANITPAQFGLLRGIDPPGPDDQIAAVQTGEGVLTAKAMKAYPGLLDAANAGTIKPQHVKGLLAAMPPRPNRRLR